MQEDQQTKQEAVLATAVEYVPTIALIAQSTAPFKQKNVSMLQGMVYSAAKAAQGEMGRTGHELRKMRDDMGLSQLSFVCCATVSFVSDMVTRHYAYFIVDNKFTIIFFSNSDEL